MPDIEQNLAVWNEAWDWSGGGDEWSEWWGGTPALWFGALLPRIHTFIPTGTILEIAPGFGRWTQFLKEVCERLVIVDIAERCIEACRERFADAGNLEYHVNDGRSLDMVDDGSIDFAFSFDSLVHAESDVLEAYVSGLARKLKPDGIGLLHHSNAGEYRALSALARRTPERPRRRLVRAGAMIDVYAWRAETVTAVKVAQQCASAGLACVSQEKISWEHGLFLTDAISVMTPRGSRWERPREVASNPMFRQEGRRMARLYSRSSLPDP
jgi:SAM-dependent methyltransferase